MISKSKLKKEIERIKELRERHGSNDNRYFLGYEDALRWVLRKMKDD